MKRIAILFIIVQNLFSCYMIAPTGKMVEYRTLLPGECLADTDLTYNSNVTASSIICNGKYSFSFALNLNNYEVDKEELWVSRVIPSDELFKSYGGKSVKKDYLKIYDACSEYADEYLPYYNYFTLITILYNGGISLVADKDFAGYQAGEDMGPYLTAISVGEENPVVCPKYNTADYLGKFLNIPLEYTGILNDTPSFGIPVGDCQLTDETVRFELKIPVKVIRYLQWMNDKKNDPDAPVPYSEEVLICKFSTRYGLR